MSKSSALCRVCGLCCNGALFADVKLRTTDDRSALQHQCASAVIRSRELARLPQPCAAYCDKLCRVYEHRPAYCRAFECALLLQVKAGHVSLRSARRRVFRVLKQLDTVGELLIKLGETDEHAPLKRRFLKVSRRLAAAKLDPRTAALYARLTLRYHRLQMILAARFYPGSTFDKPAMGSTL